MVVVTFLWTAVLYVLVLLVHEGKDQAKISKLIATQCLETIKPKSLAEKAGLRRGDFVIAVSQRCRTRML